MLTSFYRSSDDTGAQHCEQRVAGSLMSQKTSEDENSAFQNKSEQTTRWHCRKTIGEY